MTARTVVVSADPAVLRRVGADLTAQDVRTRLVRAEPVGDHVLATLAVRDGVDAPVTLGLTERRIEIVRLLAEGLSNAEIAEKLGVSPQTLKFTLARIYRKIGAEGRANAVLIACRAGLIRGGAA